METKTETKVMKMEYLGWFLAMIAKCGFAHLDDYFYHHLDIQLSFPDARVRPLVQFEDLEELDFSELPWSSDLLKKGDREMRRQEKSRRFAYLDEFLLCYYTKYHHSWWEKLFLKMAYTSPFPPNCWGWELNAIPPDKPKRIICLGDSTIRNGERLFPVVEMVGDQHRLLLLSSTGFGDGDFVVTVKY